MARWQGWGAGPAGAGSAGPSRAFLGAMAAGCLVVSAVLVSDGGYAAAAVIAVAALYFALRLFGVLGGSR